LPVAARYSATVIEGLTGEIGPKGGNFTLKQVIQARLALLG